MDLSEKLPQWERSLVQADKFAATDNALDAVARVKQVAREVEVAHDACASATDRVTLEAFLRRVERRAALLEQRYAAWAETVAARARRFEDDEHAAYRNPLAVKP